MSEEILKLWRADQEQWKAVLVECPDGLYPASDADGKTIFTNTHFDDEWDAWEALISEADAFVSLVGNDVMRAEKKLQETREDAANAAKAYALVRSQSLQRKWELEREKEAEE